MKKPSLLKTTTLLLYHVIYGRRHSMNYAGEAMLKNKTPEEATSFIFQEKSSVQTAAVPFQQEKRKERTDITQSGNV